MNEQVTSALNYAKENRQRQLDELVELLTIPSVSTQPEHDDDTRMAAEWLIGAMERVGLENVRLIETARHPLLYGDWLHAGRDCPTVLIYGHYDVQPAEPFEWWHTPPFQPTIADDYLIARGSSDDKGQIYLHLKAVESYLQSSGRLPVNVKFIIEGEEESGGASLTTFIPANTSLLAADVALVSDTAIVNKEQPAIVYGLRGLCYMLLDLQGPGRDLHSGSFGGGINNPLNALGHIIAGLKDPAGHILIPGFYDKVRPLSPEERERLAQFPLNQATWLADTGASQAWGEPEYTLIERLGARPTLDVHGIIGGYTGAGGKTVLPATVHAKISMRLVPDQEPGEIVELFTRHVQSLLPAGITATITNLGKSPACIVDYSTPAVQAAAQAYTTTYGRPPVYMREGGSIPVVGEFQHYLGLQTVLMGFGLPDDKIHAPNERFYLPNYYRGIETAIHFLANYRQLS